jgi:transcriptional regulator with XRE-family HTH domain
MEENLPIPLNIGQNIRYLRRSRDFSQKYMAFHTSIDQSLYSKIETGKVLPNENQLDKIAQTLHTDTESLKSMQITNPIYHIKQEKNQGSTIGNVSHIENFTNHSLSADEKELLLQTFTLLRKIEPLIEKIINQNS